MNLRWSVVCASAIAVVACIGDAYSQTLEDAMAAAYMNNPTLAAKRAAVRATDEGVPQAMSGWRPSVSMSGSLGSSAGAQPCLFAAGAWPASQFQFRGSGNQPAAVQRLSNPSRRRGRRRTKWSPSGRV